MALRSVGHAGWRWLRRLASLGVVALGVLPALSSAPAHAAPRSANHTIALWHLDDTSGPTVDSADSHNGTPVNVKRGVAGKFNKAYKFNGTSSEVTVPSATSLNAGSFAYTITAWVKFGQTPQSNGEDSYDVVRKGLTGAQYWKIEISKTGKTNCHFTGSKGVADFAGVGPVIADNVWHQLVCEKTSTKAFVQVDGATVSSKNVVVGSVANTNVLTMGFKKDPNVPDSDFYKGTLDEVMIQSVF